MAITLQTLNYGDVEMSAADAEAWVKLLVPELAEVGAVLDVQLDVTFSTYNASMPSFTFIAWLLTADMVGKPTIATEVIPGIWVLYKDVADRPA